MLPGYTGAVFRSVPSSSQIAIALYPPSRIVVTSGVGVGGIGVGVGEPVGSGDGVGVEVGGIGVGVGVIVGVAVGLGRSSAPGRPDMQAHRTSADRIASADRVNSRIVRVIFIPSMPHAS